MRLDLFSMNRLFLVCLERSQDGFFAKKKCRVEIWQSTPHSVFGYFVHLRTYTTVLSIGCSAYQVKILLAIPSVKLGRMYTPVRTVLLLVRWQMDHLSYLLCVVVAGLALPVEKSMRHACLREFILV